MKFADRTNWLLHPNRITAVLDALKQENASVLDLTQSNPTQCGFSFPNEQIIAALKNDRNTQYAPLSRGMKEARDAICSYYQQRNITISPDQVLVTASTSEAYSFLFRLLANPGELILFPKPSYPLFEYLSNINDVDVIHYSLTYNQGWKISSQMIEPYAADAKALVLVNPNNPTGNFIKKEELESIGQICLKNDLAIICDEVFLDYALDDSLRAMSLADHNTCLTFTLGGISKGLGLPQMKLSWIVVNGPEQTVAQAIERLEVIADTYLSVNTPAQNALKSWFEWQPQIQAEICSRIRGNYSLFQNLFIQQESACLTSQGGWNAILKLPSIYNEEQWVLDLLEKDHVLVHPGYFFDFEQEPVIVVSLLPAPKDFKQGISRIQERMTANHG